MAEAAAERIRKRVRKDSDMETSKPQRKGKASKEDETQVELQSQPTQECILVDPNSQVIPDQTLVGRRRVLILA